jgi:L-ascorbate metabolism protein UlaG (beta-lactamase superfamily)
MSGREAVQAVKAIKPRYMIPVHWLDTEAGDFEYIKTNCPETTIVDSMKGV